MVEPEIRHRSYAPVVVDKPLPDAIDIMLGEDREARRAVRSPAKVVVGPELAPRVALCVLCVFILSEGKDIEAMMWRLL